MTCATSPALRNFGRQVLRNGKFSWAGNTAGGARTHARTAAWGDMVNVSDGGATQGATLARQRGSTGATKVPTDKPKSGKLEDQPFYQRYQAHYSAPAGKGHWDTCTEDSTPQDGLSTPELSSQLNKRKKVEGEPAIFRRPRKKDVVEDQPVVTEPVETPPKKVQGEPVIFRRPAMKKEVVDEQPAVAAEKKVKTPPKRPAALQI